MENTDRVKQDEADTTAVDDNPAAASDEIDATASAGAMETDGGETEEGDDEDEEQKMTVQPASMEVDGPEDDASVMDTTDDEAALATVTPQQIGLPEVDLGTKARMVVSAKNELTAAAEYDPSLKNYHPITSACWRAGESVPYEALTRTFTAVEATTKRLDIIRMLRNFFRSVIALSPQDLVECIYLCTNELGPAYAGLELGIGDAVLVKAVAEATGRSPQQVTMDMKEAGDLGDVAQASRGKQRTLSFMKPPPRLTVGKVFNTLSELARLSGNKVQARKVEVVKGLLVACHNSEAKYIVRALGGKLRIHLAEQSVLVAVAHAFVYTPPPSKDAADDAVLDASRGVNTDKFKAQLDRDTLTLKTVYSELPDYNKVIPALLEHGFDRLHDHCSLTPGIPLKPMLAHPTKGVSEVLKRFEGNQFVCEYKYDGERAQVHRLESGEIHIYSRNQENNTSKYPDIIQRISTVRFVPVHCYLLSFVESC